MIRFLEGLLCGLLLGAVGLATVKNAVIQIGIAVMQVVQYFT